MQLWGDQQFNPTFGDQKCLEQGTPPNKSALIEPRTAARLVWLSDSASAMKAIALLTLSSSALAACEPPACKMVKLQPLTHKNESQTCRSLGSLVDFPLRTGVPHFHASESDGSSITDILWTFLGKSPPSTEGSRNIEAYWSNEYYWKTRVQDPTSLLCFF